jgi:hypothetical protein
VDDAQIEPAVECVDLHTPGPQDCDCELVVHVFNECEVPITAQGFSFARCGDEPGPCGEIAPGGEGTISEALTKVGTTEHTFPIAIGNTSATISAKTDVQSFNKGGCSYGMVVPRGSAATWLFLAALLLFRYHRRTVVACEGPS